MHRVRLASFCLSLLLTACASTPPLDMAGSDLTLTPGQAIANIDAARGQRVAWGGTIVSTRNLKETTEIEILGYPLNKSGRPEVGNAAQQRFVLVQPGYLESTDYRVGRLVSAVGTVTGMRDGRVGEAPYKYAVLRVDQLHLWPIDEAGQTNPNVRFGIGVGIIFR
jgi:outer membrane lipoprotein